MKKTFCFIIVFLLIIPIVFSQTNTNLPRVNTIPTDFGRFSKVSGGVHIPVDRTRSARDKFPPRYVSNELKGNVKTLKETNFVGFEKFGKYDIQEIKSFSISQFDAGGLLLVRNDYDIDNSLIRKCTNTFNDKKKPIECISTNLDGSVRSKYTYQYNSSGNIIEENSFDLKNTLIEKVINTYDDNLSARSIYNTGGELLGKFTFKYYESGSYNETYYEKSSNGTLHFKYINKYIKVNNSNYKLVVFIESNYGYPDIKTNYKYDDLGNPIKKNSYLISDKKYKAIEGWDTTYEYEYDIIGNWITQKEFVSAPEKGYKEQVGYLERKIEYY